MDYDLLIKITTVLIGAIGAGKLLYDLSIGRRGRMREDYNFAKQFLDEVSSNPQLHPYLREKGYQAIAGDSQLSADEIEYLLSLRNPQRALGDYVLGRKYLVVLPAESDQKIRFKAKYENPWSLRWRQYFYTSLYFALSVIALAPLLLGQFLTLSAGRLLGTSLLSVVIFGPYAFFAVKAAARIYRAIQLVKGQDKHTQIIALTASRSLSQRSP
jgi:hypothetical protein